MIYGLENRLLPGRELNQDTGSRYLGEDFATWRAVALTADVACTSTDHEYSFGCDCFQRLCGSGVCDLADDASER